MAQSLKRKKINKELGYAHRQRRKRMIEKLVDGTPCEVCGEPMSKDMDLDADHSIPRNANVGSKADRLLHAKCNRSIGDGTNAAKRHEERSKWCAMDWG